MIIRPAPRRGVYEIPFWDFVARRELSLQHCGDCGQWRYPPGPACPSCLSTSYAWAAVAGRGRVLSWTAFHRQYFDELPPPYTIVAAELNEGPILITDLAGPDDALRVDACVELCYTDAATPDGWPFVLYQWRTASGG